MQEKLPFFFKNKGEKIRVKISKLETNFVNLSDSKLILDFGQTIIRADFIWID